MDIKDYASIYINCFWRLGKPTSKTALRIHCRIGERRKYFRVQKILSIYCGAGSFNNLVLYKDGVLCMKENNKLEWLRNGLYNKITEKWN